MFATPIAYLMDEEGIVARDVALGMESILKLATAGLPSPHLDAALVSAQA